MTEKQFPVNGIFDSNGPVVVVDRTPLEYPPAATMAIEITQSDLGQGWVVWLVDSAKTFRLAIGHQTDPVELAAIIHSSVRRIDQMKKDEAA